MSVSLARTAAAVTGVLAVAGTFATAPVASASPAPTTATTAATTTVARVDVDGDGRADTVSITPTTVRGEEGYTLKVVTARKAVAKATYAAPHLYSPTWFGAARIDGVTGNELVVSTREGAHTHFYAVYSWRGGKLVAQKAPGSSSTEWFTDGAWSIAHGYSSGVSQGRKTLTVRQYDRINGGAYFRGTAVTYMWRSGGWKKASSSTVRVPQTSPKIAYAWGWHVPGLPR